MCASDSEERHWRVWKLLISMKTDLLSLVAFIISFVAFIISIGSIGLQIESWFRGADVVMRPPDQVFIFRDDLGSDKKARVHIGASMVYINKGAAGYDGIVLMEDVQFVVGAKSYKLQWDSTGNFTGSTGNIDIAEEKPALPVVLKAGTAVAHQTYFVPWPLDCTRDTSGSCNQMSNHVYWGEFIDHLKKKVQDGARYFEFRFTATVHDDEPIEAVCKIFLTPEIVGAIEANSSYEPTCYEVP